MKRVDSRKKVGYFLLLISLLPLPSMFRYSLTDQRFYLLLLTSLVLWFVASFACILDKRKRLFFGKFVFSLIFVVLSPVAFVYFEALRGLAFYHHLSYYRYFAYEIVTVLLFLTSLAVLIKSIGSYFTKKKK